MFQLTANYPRWMQRFFVSALFALILVRTLLLLGPAFLDQLSRSPELFVGVLDLAISLLVVVFSLVTIWLQRSRKRKVSDTHPLYWRTGCVSLIFAVVCWWVAHWSNQLDLREQLKLLCVLLFVVGFVMSIMTAMLYKIVAFLVWFHLQAANTKRLMAGLSMIEVPHMKAIISERQARLQFWVYQAAVFTVLVVAVWPQGMVLMGVVWLLYFALMIINFGRAAVKYRKAVSNASLG